MADHSLGKVPAIMLQNAAAAIDVRILDQFVKLVSSLPLKWRQP
jgi:hypothetical protein